jgi:hypothetical protein
MAMPDAHDLERLSRSELPPAHNVPGLVAKFKAKVVRAQRQIGDQEAEITRLRSAGEGAAQHEAPLEGSVEEAARFEASGQRESPSTPLPSDPCRAGLHRDGEAREPRAAVCDVACNLFGRFEAEAELAQRGTEEREVEVPRRESAREEAARVEAACQCEMLVEPCVARRTGGRQRRRRRQRLRGRQEGGRGGMVRRVERTAGVWGSATWAVEWWARLRIG